jgi:hypothetical protein
MKHCNKCDRNLDFSCFAKNKSKKDGLQTICKECRKVWWDNHYKENKNYYVRKAVGQKKQVQEWFKAYKSNLKCEVCGEDETCCLDFHHIDPSQKDILVSRAIVYTVKRLQKEIAKCKVLCSNCHRKVHANIITLL